MHPVHANFSIRALGVASSSHGGPPYLCFLCSLFSLLWLAPVGVSRRLRRNGFDGPSPNFPFGNLVEMSKKQHGSSSSASATASSCSSSFTNDIHSTVFPYFARWRKTFGTEPFLYIADPEFLKVVTSGTLSRKWGKPNVFKKDRKPCLARVCSWSRVGIGLITGTSFRQLSPAPISTP
uniref:Uncharacterized protein n=1 Tax=Ananas comosus var. bracteatus TaxID=296719 RepID=A0A6V7PIW3_ANACO|nr:unnamed protein product [Ananas comosus var. bracteatus]